MEFLIYFVLAILFLPSIFIVIFVVFAACTEPPDMDIVACEKCGDLYYGKDIKNKRCIKCS
jgi:hypothetical protein